MAAGSLGDAPHRLGGRAWHWHALVGALLGLAYVWTLLPGAGLGDTAELQTCAATLSLPHTPGYPLQVLWMAAFDRLVPLGTSAWRANLCNAATMIAACCALLALARRLGASAPAAAGLALAFGASLPVWRSANAAEVYALQLLLLALSFERWLAWRAAPSRARLGLAVTATGLAVTHHPLCLFALPGLALLACGPGGWRGLLRRAALQAAAALGLAVLLYGWLAWRWRAPQLAYTALWLDEPARAWFEISGGQFRGRMFGLGLQELLEARTPQFLGTLGQALAWLAPAALAGWLLPARERVRAALLLGAAGPALFALTYRIPDIESYFLPTLLCLFASSALALSWCERRGRLGAWLAPGAALALGCAHLFWNHAPADRREEARHERAALALLEHIDRDALLLWPNAEQSQLLWHLLLVGGAQGRGLHVVQDRDMGALRRYMSDGERLFERHTRRSIEPGLTPWACSEAAIAALRARGFELEPERGGVARVLAAPPVTPR